MLYSAITLWIGGALAIGGWGFYLETQMANHLVNKPKLISLNGGRRFAFQRNPNDYDAIGQGFLKRAVKNERWLFAWIFAFFLIVVIIGSISR